MRALHCLWELMPASLKLPFQLTTRAFRKIVHYPKTEDGIEHTRFRCPGALSKREYRLP
jgi:hypothetical protein